MDRTLIAPALGILGPESSDPWSRTFGIAKTPRREGKLRDGNRPPCRD